MKARITIGICGLAFVILGLLTKDHAASLFWGVYSGFCFGCVYMWSD
jgi:hypothetical protein